MKVIQLKPKPKKQSFFKPLGLEITFEELIKKSEERWREKIIQEIIDNAPKF